MFTSSCESEFLGSFSICLSIYVLSRLFPAGLFCAYVCFLYNPQGSVCEDWPTVYCCYPLAVCQMIREMKQRMKTQTYHVSTALVSS